MSESFDKKWKYIQKYMSKYIFPPKNKSSDIGNSSKLWNTLYQQQPKNKSSDIGNSSIKLWNILYQQQHKAYQNPEQEDYDPEFLWDTEDPHISRRKEQGGAWHPNQNRNISMVDEYGDVDVPRPITYRTEDCKWQQYNARWAVCNKHEPKENTLYYDTNKIDECPKCKAMREELPEFLSESDMQL